MLFVFFHPNSYTHKNYTKHIPKKKEKNKSITKVRTNALAFFSKTSTNEEIKILNEPKTGLMFVCIGSFHKNFTSSMMMPIHHKLNKNRI